MYIRLIDKGGWRSPIFHIHSDEEEFLQQIEVWKKEIHQIHKDYPHMDGLPLGRMDAGTCMFDLIRHLGNYYVESTPLSFIPKGHVYSCLKLIEDKEEETLKHEDVLEIKTWE